MGNEETIKKMGKVIAKAWADDSFRQKLLDYPAETLAAEGLEIPAGLKEIRAVENTDEIFHFVIPAKPTGLAEESLTATLGVSCLCFSVCGVCRVCQVCFLCEDDASK